MLVAPPRLAPVLSVDERIKKEEGRLSILGEGLAGCTNVEVNPELWEKGISGFGTLVTFINFYGIRRVPVPCKHFEFSGLGVKPGTIRCDVTGTMQAFPHTKLGEIVLEEGVEFHKTFDLPRLIATKMVQMGTTALGVYFKHPKICWGR